MCLKRPSSNVLRLVQPVTFLQTEYRAHLSLRSYISKYSTDHIAPSGAIAVGCVRLNLEEKFNFSVYTNAR